MGDPFDVKWIHGSENCSANVDPPLQVHQFDESTYILRQNKCANFEAPFLYLLFGQSKAFLLDTGAEPAPGQELPLQQTVQSIIRRRLEARAQKSIDLIVAHSHSHGDHTYGDSQFTDQPHTTVVGPNLTSVQRFFGFQRWPEDHANLDLGGRMLTVSPIPGHETDHLAIYDARTSILFTGDSVYPGLLTVRDWSAFRASAARLTAFCSANQVSFLLGAHIEMKRSPREFYPIGTTYQPDEHVLQLQPRHIQELNELCQMMGPVPQRVLRDDFILDPLN
jgi:hydroxyacylglutathione hydrolase